MGSNFDKAERATLESVGAGTIGITIGKAAHLFEEGAHLMTAASSLGDAGSWVLVLIAGPGPDEPGFYIPMTPAAATMFARSVERAAAAVLTETPLGEALQ